MDQRPVRSREPAERLAGRQVEQDHCRNHADAARPVAEDGQGVAIDPGDGAVPVIPALAQVPLGGAVLRLPRIAVQPPGERERRDQPGSLGGESVVDQPHAVGRHAQPRGGVLELVLLRLPRWPADDRVAGARVVGLQSVPGAGGDQDHALAGGGGEGDRITRGLGRLAAVEQHRDVAGLEVHHHAGGAARLDHGGELAVGRGDHVEVLGGIDPCPIEVGHHGRRLRGQVDHREAPGGRHRDPARCVRPGQRHQVAERSAERRRHPQHLVLERQAGGSLRHRRRRQDGALPGRPGAARGDRLEAGGAGRGQEVGRRLADLVVRQG